jgi:periplasmic copper chaperone A
MTSTTALSRRAAFAMLGALALAACGSGGDSSSGRVTVRDAWIRTTATGQTDAAVYLTIDNSTDQADALVAAQVPTSVAASTQLHETVTTGTTTSMPMSSSSTDGIGAMTSTSMSGSSTGGMGEMGMQPVARIEVAAHATSALSPGGYHIMLISLAKPLAAGDTVPVTLTFSGGMTTAVTAVVRDG